MAEAAVLHQYLLAHGLGRRRQAIPGLLKGVLLGDAEVEGSLLQLKTFLGCFDFSEVPIALTLR